MSWYECNEAFSRVWLHMGEIYRRLMNDLLLKRFKNSVLPSESSNENIIYLIARILHPCVNFLF